MYILLWASAVILTLSGLDDFIVDILYWINRNKYKLSLPDTNQMYNAEEYPIAMVIACWHEQSVIGRTISLALERVEYNNYKIFIGVYQNDAETIAEVKKYSETDSRVIMCINPKDGPTSKADNLNNAFYCKNEYEKEHGTFGVVLIHDSEDFIHPMSFKLYNYLIIHKGYYAVQIPVYPIKSGLGNMYHKIYCDSFAEAHTKDMIVRQSIGSFVPFAGTGMAFNWITFKYLETTDNRYLEYLKNRFAHPEDEKYRSEKAEEMASINDIHLSDSSSPISDSSSPKNEVKTTPAKRKRIFNEANLTEDYEIGLKFHKLGLKAKFVNLLYRRENEDFHIATHSYFPNTFWTAVKQRSRWVAGINLQNWAIHKWNGSLVTKWFLLRDRKGLFTNIFIMVSFILILDAFLCIIDKQLNWDIFKSLLTSNSVIWYLLFLILFFTLVRLFHRFFFTFKWYGLKYAVMSLFRMFVENVINFFAVFRAFKIYYFMKSVLVWDKTEHY